MSTITGSIGGTSIEGHVRAMSRRAHLCSPGQWVTLNLSPEFPYDPSTGDEIIIYEQDTLVLTGYVQKVSRSKPSFDWIVEGMDTYQRCQSFFIEDVIVAGHDPITEQPIVGYVPQSTDYWLAYLFDLCGASYSIQGGGYSVPQGVQIGMRTVHESLQDILAYSSQYVFPAPNGTIEVKRANRSAQNYHLTDFIHFEYKEDDEWTRNVIKVYGLNSGYGSRQQRVFATASVSLPNIIPDRVTAIATPMIQVQAEAQRVADYMLSELGEVTWIATGTIEGNPNIRIGQSARMTYLDYDRTDVITSLETDWNENGYIMQVTTGERCPRISGWARTYPPVFAGTTQHGVYKSIDGGINWAEFNVGLPIGSKYVKRLGFNSFKEGMAIVNGSLYYTDGLVDTWLPRSLPAPQNMAGDVPSPGYGGMVAVDATGGLGSFAVLTTAGLPSSGSSGQEPGEMRSWIYTCENSGSSPAAWSSTEMTTGSATANPYNLYGYDMTASGGVPIAVLSSGSHWADIANIGWKIAKVNETRRAYDYWAGWSRGWACSSNAVKPNWRVSKMYNKRWSATQAETYIDLDISFSGGRSWVYLYGSYEVSESEAFIDSQGYRYWEFSSDFYRVNQWTYRTSLRLPYDPMPEIKYRTIYFNMFLCYYGALSPIPSLTCGDICNEGHQVGQSPYGDRGNHQGGPSQVYFPYPFKSTLLEGIIYL